MFEPTIQFRYRFRDVEYTGHRVAFGDLGTSDRVAAEKIADRFAAGTLWSVSVCERRPHMAVLHPGVHRRLWFAVYFFLVYVTLAVSLLADALRQFA